MQKECSQACLTSCAQNDVRQDGGLKKGRPPPKGMVACKGTALERPQFSCRVLVAR